MIALAAIATILTAQPPRPSHSELHAILVNDQNLWNPATRDFIFYHEGRLRSSIRSFLRDSKARRGAQEILALIGDPEDVGALIRLAPPPRSGPLSNHWAYGVACALLEPRSQQEWAFLRRCALNLYGVRWVDAGAIQTLKLIASPRSLQILKEVQHRNAYRAGSVARAIDYAQSNPSPLRGERLAELAERVANVIKIGKWEGNHNIRYNSGGDKALIDFVYNTGEDRLTYTATFHRVDGLWRLRGARETLQEFGMPLGVVVESPPFLPPPPELILAPPAIPPALDQILPPVTAPNPPKDEPANPKKN